MIFVIVEGGPSPGVVDDARPLVIDRVPVLGRNHANRPIAEKFPSRRKKSQHRIESMIMRSLIV
jgi:hypothetical protein